MTLHDYNVAAWRRFSTEGRRAPDNHIARLEGWPTRFAGTRDEFLRFDRPVDLAAELSRGRRALVSRWNTGPLSRWLVPFNFKPKTEWPDGDSW